MNKILTQVKQAIRHPYAWPGGYPVYVILSDGALLCPQCARAEYRQIARGTLHGLDDGWRAVGADVLWEGTDQCGHCAKELPSAYGSPDDDKLWWSSSDGRLELCMTLEQAQSASHQGQCDEDVKALSQVPAIAAQLAAFDPALVRKELQGHGAWDEAELADHEQNIQRVLWIAAGDIAEENR